MPPRAANAGSAARRGSLSSPSWSSRRISRPDDEEEDDHQAVVDPEVQVALERQGAQPRARAACATAPGSCSCQGEFAQASASTAAHQQQDAAGRLDRQEALDRREISRRAAARGRGPGAGRRAVGRRRIGFDRRWTRRGLGSAGGPTTRGACGDVAAPLNCPVCPGTHRGQGQAAGISRPAPRRPPGGRGRRRDRRPRAGCRPGSWCTGRRWRRGSGWCRSDGVQMRPKQRDSQLVDRGNVALRTWLPPLVMRRVPVAVVAAMRPDLEADALAAVGQEQQLLGGRRDGGGEQRAHPQGEVRGGTALAAVTPWGRK